MLSSSLATASVRKAVILPRLHRRGYANQSDPGEPQLCPEQRQLIDYVKSGSNVFFTGSAGSGKTTVLRALSHELDAMRKTVHIVAPTGRAALHVNGQTTWAYASWKPSHLRHSLQELKNEACRTTVKKRLRSTDVLIIDEISLVENHHLERLNEIMKEARGLPDLAFGGAQLVVTGDFCQLPPIKPFQFCIECGSELIHQDSNGGMIHTCSRHGIHYDKDKWAFRSKAWQECKFNHIHLKTIHRQKDPRFLSILHKLRVGTMLSQDDIDTLMNHPCETENATRLYPTRKEAAEVNQQAFKRLKGENHTYWCRDEFIWRSALHPQLKHKGTRKLPGPQSQGPLVALQEHQFDECVQLKEGMPVVLLVNLSLADGLCNGSQGVVCGFEEYDPTKFTGYIPIRDGNTEQSVIQSDEINRFIRDPGVSHKVWPIVRFHNGETRTIYANCSDIMQGDVKPYSLLVRTQIPLAPAWAMTIHKSQGLTLDRAIVDLSNAFESGQVYVALSRVRELQGLKIEGDPKGLLAALGANPEVAKFHRERFGDLSDIVIPGLHHTTR